MRIFNLLCSEEWGIKPRPFSRIGDIEDRWLQQRNTNHLPVLELFLIVLLPERPHPPLDRCYSRRETKREKKKKKKKKQPVDAMRETQARPRTTRNNSIRWKPAPGPF